MQPSTKNKRHRETAESLDIQAMGMTLKISRCLSSKNNWNFGSDLIILQNLLKNFGSLEYLNSMRRQALAPVSPIVSLDIKSFGQVNAQDTVP